jgi:hypothetical protein
MMRFDPLSILVSSCLVDALLEKVNEYYRVSRRLNRHLRKSDFDPTVEMSGEKVSIFNSSRINELLFLNGMKIDIQSFFIDPYRRNISTVLFILTEPVRQFYCHDHVVNLSRYLHKPDELAFYTIHTVHGCSIYVDVNRVPKILGRLGSLWALFEFLKFQIELRRELLQHINLIAWCRMLDLLMESSSRPSLQKLLVGGIITANEYYRRHADWLQPILNGNHGHQLGFCRLVPENLGGALEANIPEKTFTNLVKRLQKPLKTLRVRLGRKEIPQGWEHLFVAVLKDCRVGLLQEISPGRFFTHAEVMESIRRDKANTGILNHIWEMASELS